MSMRSWIIGAGVVAVGIVGATVLFSSAERDATADAGDGPVVLHRGNGAEPSTLDPHKLSGTWENRIVGDLMVGLYQQEADNSPIFAAATSHDVSEDGLTHTFTLRADMVWSDGQPVTAYDFEYSFRRMVNPATAAEFASFHYFVVNARAINFGEITDLTQLGVEAVDDHTLVMYLERPYPHINQLLATYLFHPVPRHLVEEHGDRWTRPGTMVSNGPYVLAEWVPNDYIRAVKNERFYQADQVQIDEVFYYPTDDAAAALRRFRAGELDLNTEFPEQQIEWLRANLPNETRTSSSTCVGYITVNTVVEPFDNPNLRNALGMAINRESLSEHILGLGELPAYSISSPFAEDYPAPQPYWASLNMEDRQNLARELLAEAGFTAENPLSFTYRYRESIRNRRAAIAVAGMWRDIGIEVDIVNTEVAVHYADLRAGNFVVGDGGWCPLNADPAEILILLHSESGDMNTSKYDNPEFDVPFDQALVTPDAVERSRLMAQAEQAMLNDMPLIPSYYYVDKNLVGQHVQGWVDNPNNTHRTRWLSIDESLRPEQRNALDQIRRLFN